MNIIFKVIGYLLGVLIVITLGVYLYMFREQSIDIDLVPTEFKYCGKQIYGDDESYENIVKWLKNNSDDWVLSFASYVPIHRYYHGAFNVNVHREAVIVSYKTDYGYPQFIKQGQHDLPLSCN